MSVFNRISGTEEPKIPVWPIMTAFRSLLDGAINAQQFYALMEITVPEQAELTEYKTAIETRITGVASLLRIGFDLDNRAGLAAPVKAQLETLCTSIARALVFTQLFNMLLMIEQKTITLNQFRVALGLAAI